MKPSKEQMYQWYVEEELSFRKIMKLMETRNNRAIPKLLNEYGIEIRRGSEAVKTQWVNNDSRKKAQAEFLSRVLSGRESHRRLSNEDIKGLCENKNLHLVKIEYANPRTYIYCKCKKCGEESKKELSNLSNNGCRSCSLEARTFADQTTARGQRARLKPWKRMVHERDNFECKCCGAKDELRAHHIENFAQNEHLRADVDNGITLCQFCHDGAYEGSFHNVYGLYGNTGEQLEDYLKNFRKYQSNNKQLAFLK